MEVRIVGGYYAADLQAVLETVLAHHTRACVKEFLGVGLRHVDHWACGQGDAAWPEEAEDRAGLLRNLRTLAAERACPCQTGEEWGLWFERGLVLPKIQTSAQI